ncbi:hypothetical protein HHI36_017341 [Cryptolaemus montrouzieri]|uniref:Uncharacterized protein n=1 Tax=Cryptolaemus montrouzieri TaxID=559131 RepID=A0ABD2NN93_9CUCU
MASNEFSDAHKNFLDFLLEKHTKAVNSKIDDVDKKVAERSRIRMMNEVSELKRRFKRNNIVFHGVEAVENDFNSTPILKLLKNVLEIEISENNLNNCYRVGRNRKRGPLVVELSSFRIRPDVQSTPASLSLKTATKPRREGRFLFIDNKKYTAYELTQPNCPYYGASSDQLGVESVRMDKKRPRDIDTSPGLKQSPKKDSISNFRGQRN